MVMSAMRRSAVWSSALDKNAASTSLTEWCNAPARVLPWTLVACDAVSHTARFVQSPDNGNVQLQPRSVHCHLATLEVEAIGADADVTATTAVSAHTTSVIDPDVVFPSALALAAIVYLVYALRHARRHAPPTNTKPSRCGTVDVFRGLTICLMVFVNYGGGGFTEFQHSAWDGLTVADVVFPCFAWIMGFTMYLGTSSGRPATPWRRVLHRSAKLFAIGLFLNNGSSWTEWRIPGVLQSLSAGYLITACLTRAVGHLLQQYGTRIRLGAAVFHSIVGIAPIVAVNLALTFALHVPGCPRGYLGPGGDSDGGLFRNCTGGAHLLIDRSVFSERHIYQTPTCQAAFHTGSYDPEGLLNWLMVAATSYCGFLAGARFKATESSGSRVQMRASLVQGMVFLLAASIVSGGFGVFLKLQWIPLNKNLWSLSYVLVSVAVANVAFAALTFSSAADHADAHASLPWTSTWSHVGQNSIFIYTMHEILQSFAPFSPRGFSLGDANDGIPQIAGLLQNVASVLWWMFVAEWMHARGIMLTV